MITNAHLKKITLFFFLLLFHCFFTPNLSNFEAKRTTTIFLNGLKCKIQRGRIPQTISTYHVLNKEILTLTMRNQIPIHVKFPAKQNGKYI